MKSDQQVHDQGIVEQFTLQAKTFAAAPALSDAAFLKCILDAIQLQPDDTVLDVACGPGLVACAMAGVARHITGIDLTEAMLEQGKLRQQKLGLSNLTWQLGNALALPYADASFSVVHSRYSLHHTLDPQAVVAEMVRVCKPGGKLAIGDVYVTNEAQGKAYDHLEKLRDPSHVRALELNELRTILQTTGITNLREAYYGLESDLEELLGRAYTTPAALDEIRQIFSSDLTQQRLGVKSHLRENRIWFEFPTVIMVGQKVQKKL
ncbi:MAG: methyltransferase domain-containing protein [Gemmatales bacterium]